MAPVAIVCFGLTTDSTEAEWAELITIILNFAAMMHHSVESTTSVESMKDWSTS